MQTFVQAVRVPAYIFRNYFSCCRRRPCEIICFPAGLHYLLTFPTRMSKISQKSMCLYANFSEKGCLYIAIYANFSKGSVDPRGNTSSSATEIIGNCLHVSQTSHFSQNHLSKSNNFNMFVLEANTLFLLFRSCSNRVKPRQLEPWYIEASAYVE